MSEKILYLDGLSFLKIISSYIELSKSRRLKRLRDELSKLNSEELFVTDTNHRSYWWFYPTELLRKEVIQPQVPLRLPCYDFTPVTIHSLGPCLLAVSSGTSGANDSHGVTGGVYKARERIHRCLLISDY